MSWLTTKVKPDSPALTGVYGDPRALVLIKFVIAVGVLAGLYWLAFWYLLPEAGLWPKVFAGVAIPAYCVLCYFFEPDPDQYDEHIVDRPGQVDRSDVQGLLIMTWPGRFVAKTAVQVVLLVRHAFD